MFLMIGALLAVPYIVLFIWATQVAAVDPVSGVVAFALLLLLLVVPALLAVTRALERTAARELLGVQPAEPVKGMDAGRRWRGAAWYVVHLMSGGLTVVTVAFAVPVVITLAVLAMTGDLETVTEVTGAVLPSADTTTAVLWALGLGLGVTIFNILAGIALPHWARIMLGPTSAERAALEAEQAKAAARRNQLARELHDSVGHALTVTTLQATAAQGMLGRDPEAAARAMQAVAETGRAALAELDHVIGILRSGDDGGTGGAEGPVAVGLTGLPVFIDRLEEQGLHVARNYDESLLSAVPAPTSYAAFKVLQEGLTNALKYAKPQEARLNIVLDDSWLRLQLTNPVNGTVAGRASGGRGLEGMRERARLAGGTAEIGMDDGVWSLRAGLPTAEPLEEQA
ncbi:histidine kinase [Arthrobacter pigmenti]